jgi:hypothetical protein
LKGGSEHQDWEVSTMPDIEPHVDAGSEGQRRFLLDFLRDMDGHISALQAAGHKRLVAAMDSPDAAPMSVEITIRVGPEPYPSGGVALDEAPGAPSCATVKVPCGEGPTGYIYCEISYCETTGPVTVSPG